MFFKFLYNKLVFLYIISVLYVYSLNCLVVCTFQVQSFFAAVKALSRKEVHYGAHATSEQVLWMPSFDFAVGQ